MGIKDLIRAPGALREMRTESERLTEIRESINFTERLIAHSLAVATGTFSPDAAQTAAVEFAAGLVGRALAVADVQPELAARLLTPARLMDIGRKLTLTGNYVASIEIERGLFRLRAARQWQIIRGGVDERTWVYELELAAPSGALTKRQKSVGVLHIRINADSREPWLGTSQLLSAGISAELLARVESKTADEMRAQVGSLLPVPEGMSPENRTALQTDLAQAKGDTLIVETQANAHGLGRQSAPQLEWTPRRMGANIPESHVTLRSDVARDVCGSLGVPGSLYSGADGATVREGYRQLLVSTLQPLARIIESEFTAKVGYPTQLTFQKLAAADVAAKARAYGILVSNGVDKEDAAQVSGLILVSNGVDKEDAAQVSGLDL